MDDSARHGGFQVRNLATDTVLAMARECTSDQLDKAFASVLRSFPSWSAEREIRCAALLEVADRIEKESSALPALITAEQGKPLSDADWEIQFAVAWCRYLAAPPGPDETLQADEHSTVRIGALTRDRMVTQQTADPLLAEAASWIGRAAIRYRGTFGGSIAHADPAAELPLMAAAMSATVNVVRQNGRQAIVASELFEGALQTSLADNEVIESADFPAMGRWGGSPSSPIGHRDSG